MDEIPNDSVPDLRDCPLSSLVPEPYGVVDETVGRVLAAIDRTSSISVATFNSYI
jgi:hypothetical protein